MTLAHQQIAILDFGSQYTHLIARRFRQLGILAKLYPTDYDVSQIENLIGIVLSGSPGSVNDERYPFNPNIFTLGLPVLGLCYGHQLMAKHFGGQVEKSNAREYGQAVVNIGQSRLFEGLAGGETVWMSHGDSVSQTPLGFKVIGATLECPIAAMANEEKKLYSLQFHPEVTHTIHGMKILENFAFKICQAEKDWNVADWQNEIIVKIKKQAENKKVFLLVSGGVDSTVCFALLEKALGADRVYGLHVDTGLMRKKEVEQVEGSLAQAGFKNLHIQDASEQFLSALEGVCEPEAKRKIIGKLFLDIKDQVAEQLKLNPEEWLLAQGTIYPDTIETGGTKNADKIKTHHNQIDQLKELIKQGKVLEPLSDLYKDEVRVLGESLGLSEKLVWRQPFPGPGLGIRVLCSDTNKALPHDYLKDINSKLEKALNRLTAKDGVWKNASISLLPVKSVGVQGDERSYAHPAVLEMKKINWEEIEKISPLITNGVKEINRVLLRVDNGKFLLKSGQLIKSALHKARLDLLREIDALVQEEIFKANLEKDIWQFPVVLLPFGIDNKESIVLRPVSSLEAMTARFYPLPADILQNIIAKIEALGQTSFVFYDATNKPPGTIEWE